jgi:penicillin amidase
VRARPAREETFVVRKTASLVGSALSLGLVGATLAMSCSLEPLPCSDCAAGGAGGAPEETFHPSAAIDVRRDHLGVVHVYGKTDGDAVYGDGYMQAVDRLFQMDLVRRQALGRQAEVLGAAKEDDDRIVRVMGIAQRGHENAVAMKAAHPDTHALVEAWVAGVNARIAEVNAGKAPMPAGFADLGYAPEPWTEDDVFAVGKLIVFGNGNQLTFDVLATAIEKFAPTLFQTLPFFDPLEDAFILDVANGPVASLATSAIPSSPGAPRPRKAASATTGAPPPALPLDAAERVARFRHMMASVHPRASNNFAIDGRHTKNGHSIIGGDPHQGLRSPSLMWLHHLNSADAGGTLDVEGWSFVGTPGVSLGHNRSVAWTATTNYPDVTDLWDVTKDPEGNVLVGGTPVPVLSRTETFDVKDKGKVELTVEEVPGYGVLLPDDLVPLPLVDGGHHILFDWTGFRPTNEAHAFVLMDKAKTLDDFEAAVDQFELGSFNMVAATRDGITYRSSPLVPDRGDPATHAPSYYMMQGDDPSTFWTGAFLSGDQLPHSRAATSGIIVTANNDPFGFTKDGSLLDDPFYFGAFFDPGARAQRAYDDIVALTKKQKIGVLDMTAVQTDVHSVVADELLPMLDASYAKVPTDDTLAAYRNRPDLDALVLYLDGWSRDMRRSLGQPVAFEAFMYFLTRDVIADDMSLFFQPVLGEEPIYVVKYAIIALKDPAQTFVQGGKDATILKALDETAQFLTQKYGHVDFGFTWGGFHSTAFPSDSIAALDGGSVPTDGAEGTINVSSGDFFDAQNQPIGTHVSSSGSIYRMVASFDDAGTPQAFFDMPRGSSGEPGDPHYDDLTADWADEKYQPLLFTNADIEADTTERLTIGP